MTIIWIVLLLIFLLCFFIYQWWFEQSRFRQMTEKRKAMTKWYGHPLFWMILSILVFLALIGIISYYIMGFAESMLSLY